MYRYVVVSTVLPPNTYESIDDDECDDHDYMYVE